MIAEMTITNLFLIPYNYSHILIYWSLSLKRMLKETDNSFQWFHEQRVPISWDDNTKTVPAT